MKKRYFWIILSMALPMLFAACDDSTEGLGESMMPDKDHISIDQKVYTATSRSLLAGDSILAKTSTAYLGRYTDPLYGTFEADFLAQFHCVEDFQFPEGGVAGDTAVSAEVRLYVSSFFGDSISPSHLSVYPLNKVLEEEKNYYTDLVPEEYYDATQAPLASRPYTAEDKTIPDSITEGNNYVPYIRVQLPRQFGTDIIRKYYDNPQNFANAEAFINNVCKGMYFKCDQGDGSILYVQQAQLNVTFKYFVQSSSGRVDSLITVVAQFAGTQEVIQANRFKTDKEKLKELVDNDGSCTYLKTPAGIFTEVTLPLDEIAANHINAGDTLNSVKFTLTRYNETVAGTEPAAFKMGVPKTILMVRKKDMYTFFEKNQVADNKTSYLTTFNSSDNTYTFNNMSQLITECIAEKNSGQAIDEDWNKVVLIPVVTTKDNTNNIVTIRHNLNLTSARLMGGFNPGNELQVRITYSKFAE
ncbi:MAG: DUF4270 domain-containing protein [Bacteroidaceae bacterium]|nr:DUF4270 domain-containing protein [Bacteroidaceae bacterium]